MAWVCFVSRPSCHGQVKLSFMPFADEDLPYKVWYTPPLKSPPKPATRVSTSSKVHDSVVSSIDELEDFAMGRMHNNANRRSNIHTGETTQKSAANTNRRKEAANPAKVNQSTSHV